jgi:DNA-binding GntR family transcriptional regulator
MAGRAVSSDRIKEVLTERILSGALQPGEILNEGALADEFAVSRTPIREAIRKVAATGLITTRPHQRSFVAKLELGQALAMFEAASAVEGVAAEFAARRRAEQDVAAMRALHEESAPLVAEGRLADYFDLNERLHAAIYRASGNAIIAATALDMRAKLRLFRGPRQAQPGRMRESYAEHARILDAIAAGDADAASRAMRRHTMMQGETLMAFVNQFNAPAGDKAAE